MKIHDILVQLALKHSVCSIAKEGKATTWSGLFVYGPFLKTDEKYFEENPDACYVFEVGINNGLVFSERLVKSIEMTNSGAIIHLI